MPPKLRLEPPNEWLNATYNLLTAGARQGAANITGNGAAPVAFGPSGDAEQPLSQLDPHRRRHAGHSKIRYDAHQPLCHGHRDLTAQPLKSFACPTLYIK